MRVAGKLSTQTGDKGETLGRIWHVLTKSSLLITRNPTAFVTSAFSLNRVSKQDFPVADGSKLTLGA